MNQHRIVPAIVCLSFLGALAGAAFLSKDSPDYYVLDGKIVAVSPALSEKSVSNAATRFRYLYDTYLEPNSMDAYTAVIPDKSYYLPDPKRRNALDYDALCTLLYEQMEYATPLDLADTLNGDSYYATDSHWRQECLAGTAASLYAQMSGTADAALQDYATATATDHFTGSYADAPSTAGPLGRHAFSNIVPDALRYLTNDTLEQAVVWNYDTGQATGVYDFDKLAGSNCYDFFLSGPTALLTIENPQAENEQMLVVFRDSYGSSLIPLLVPYYEKILVVDIRYTMSSKLGELVDFSEYEEADALYLYSTAVLNKSVSLR